MTAPKGTVGRIGIPKVEKTITTITINGKLAWDGTYHAVAGIEDAEFVYFTDMQPGAYEFSVTYQGTTPAYDEPPESYAAQWVKIVNHHSCGVYVVYTYDKSVKFRINKVRGDLVTLSGIFFGHFPD